MTTSRQLVSTPYEGVFSWGNIFPNRRVSRPWGESGFLGQHRGNASASVGAESPQIANLVARVAGPCFWPEIRLSRISQSVTEGSTAPDLPDLPLSPETGASRENERVIHSFQRTFGHWYCTCCAMLAGCDRVTQTRPSAACRRTGRA